MDVSNLKRQIAKYIVHYGSFAGLFFSSLLVSFLHDNSLISTATYYELLDFLESRLTDF